MIRKHDRGEQILLGREELVRYAFLDICKGCSRFQIGIPSGCSTLSMYFGS